jgi:predicted RNase H-like HicB family nuclease
MIVNRYDVNRFLITLDTYTYYAKGTGQYLATCPVLSIADSGYTFTDALQNLELALFTYIDHILVEECNFNDLLINTFEDNFKTKKKKFKPTKRILQFNVDITNTNKVCITKLKEDIKTLKNAGQQMSNYCFNMSQAKDNKDASVMKEMYKKWDKAYENLENQEN